MDRLSGREFRELASAEGQIRVSIYMPTHVGSPEEFQDAVRLKTLLDQAERELLKSGMTPQETDAMLSAARKLPEQATLWHDRGQGLALFIDQNGYRVFRVPIKFDERVAVSDRFVTRQLLPLVVQDRKFLLLAFGRQHVQLYRGSRFALEEIDVPKLPTSLAQALQIESADRGLQLHSIRPVGAAGKAGVFHGQGGQRDADERQFREYVHAINNALGPILAKSSEPLVLACVGYEAAEFKSVCRYPQILEAIIPGDSTKWNKRDLHQKAWAVVAPTLDDEESKFAGRYLQQFGTGTTSNQIDEIVVAAHNGDLDTLLVDAQVQAWGRYEPAAQSLVVHKAYQALDHDLVDQAMAQTYLSKGTVRVLPTDKMPSTSGLAAIYRTGRIPRAPSPTGLRNGGRNGS